MANHHKDKNPFTRVAAAVPPQLSKDMKAYHDQLTAAGIRHLHTDTIRELLSLGMSGNPIKVIETADRVRAYNETRTYVHRKFIELCQSLIAELQRADKEGTGLLPELEPQAPTGIIDFEDMEDSSNGR